MSDFESNIRSIERATRKMPDDHKAKALLVVEGVLVVVENKDRNVQHLVSWHELAMWQSPQGASIMKRLIGSLFQKQRVFP